METDPQSSRSEAIKQLARLAHGPVFSSEVTIHAAYEHWFFEVDGLIEQLGDHGGVHSQIREINDRLLRKVTAFPIGKMLRDAEMRMQQPIDVPPPDDGSYKEPIAEIKSLIARTLNLLAS